MEERGESPVAGRQYTGQMGGLPAMAGEKSPLHSKCLISRLAGGLSHLNTSLLSNPLDPGTAVPKRSGAELAFSAEWRGFSDW